MNKFRLSYYGCWCFLIVDRGTHIDKIELPRSEWDVPVKELLKMYGDVHQ